MVTVIALTQFAFLALGIVALKILIHASGSETISPYLQNLDRLSLWLFAVPLLWIGFASVCAHINRFPLVTKVAQTVGVLLAVACGIFTFVVAFLPGL
ncbi:MAG: hypothetical protein ACOVMP_03350 [Chthoniobacterales bacterium]